jgi:hypothetical protein
MEILRLIKQIDIKFLNNFIKKNLLKLKIINSRSLLQKSSLKNTIYVNNINNEISKLCEKYGSDKGYVEFDKKTPYAWKPHTYSNFYYQLFDHCKDNIRLVFECGIGTNNAAIPSNMTTSGKPGASLRVWRDYFKNAEIYGADIDDKILFLENRIKTFYVNQLETQSIEKMWLGIDKNNFDLIIDDGLHNFEAGMQLFKNSYSKLRNGGIYIIEDVGHNYFNKLLKSLKDFNPEGIELTSKNYSQYYNNNLIIIRKV